MLGIDLGSPYVWVVIALLGIGSFSLRLSFIQLYGWLLEFPPWVERALTFLPPAILAALVFSQVITFDGSLVQAVVNERSIAAIVATVVAWRTGNMLATIGVGMAVLWMFVFIL